MQISWLSIICMTLTIVICFFYPIVMVMYTSKRYKTGLKPVLIGILIFISFALVLKNVGVAVLLLIPGFQTMLTGLTLVSAVFGALMAGLFEETGRLLAFKHLNKKGECKDLGTALAYGAGHGGIEAILIVGLTMFNTLLLAMTINFSGAEAMVAGLDANTAQTINEGIRTIAETNSLMFLVSGLERFVAMSFHIAASVLIYTCVVRNKKHLYPLAIILHTALNIPAGLYQTQIITNIWVTEILCAAVAAGVCIFAYYISINNKHN